MPARTGRSTYVPGRGTTVRSKSGKAKTYEGSGPAPSGTKKVTPKTAATAPTVTISPSGNVTTSNYGTQKAARRAERAAKASRRRVRRIRRIVNSKPQKPSQPSKPVKYSPPPLSKPKSFAGKPTAGAPTSSELTRAKQAGTLKVNRKGYVTTPKVRQVSTEVKQAKLAVKKSGPKVEGPLTPGQKTFVKKVARETGLSPRVIAAQALAEESGSAAASREAEGNHNWLNIGYYDSGPGSLTQDSTWSNPKSAAHATAQFFKGKKYGPSAGIRSIITTRGKSDQAQMHAIANSGWASSAYGGSLAGTYAEVNATRGNPKALKRLKKVKGKARELGLATGKKTETGHATPKQVSRLKAAQAAARQVDKLHLPYVWGGGHNSGAVNLGSGVDCSGAVSYVLQKMGVKLPGGVVSGDMGSYLKPGPGAVTVFYNPEHTFMRIGNKYFGTSGSNPGGGAGFIPKSVAGPEAASGKYSVAHVPGLGQKVALALGVSGAESFPGMTLSSSGTTATINPGAGATVSQPGFSSKPIKLTPLQKLHRANRKLRGLSLGGTPEPTTEAKTTIADLERKYGKQAV